MNLSKNQESGKDKMSLTSNKMNAEMQKEVGKNENNKYRMF